MSIAEKLVTVAENVPKVFNAGKLSVISQSEALKGSVSGSSVTMRDISPVEHNIKCTLSGEGIDLSRVKVQRLGKNLLNAMGLASNNNATDYVQDEANNSFTIRGDEGTLAYLFNTGQLMFPHANNTILAEQGIPVKAGVTYILSFDCLLLEQGKYNEYIRAVVTLGNIETILAQLDAKGVIGTTTRHYLKFMAPTDGKLGLVFRINNNYVKISNIQIEIGATGTEFEPYIEPTEHIANADGTVEGIKSLYPNMTLMSDTKGVIITAEYIKDVDKAFEERLAEIEKALVNN